MHLILALIFGLTWARKPPLYFKTEPTVEQESINLVTKPNTSAIAPGFIFVSRWGKGPKGVHIRGWGPEIFDSSGALVWSGRLDLSIWYAKRFHVCNYPGSRGKHLCFHQSVRDYAIWHPGFITFLDDSYFLVAQFGRMGLDWPEGHELNTPLSCSHCLLQVVFQNKMLNITHGGRTQERPVVDGCFQEVDMLNRSATFEWCALDHLPTRDLERFVSKHTNKVFKPKVGRTDLWHINGVDRDQNGDYLISLRWLDNILKIAGKNSPNPGSVIWRLGTDGNFSEDFKFAGQHSARFLNSTQHTETIYFFNNAWQGGKEFPKTSDFSSGYLVEINHKHNTARLLKSFDSPERKISNSRGSMQMLSNGNAFIGWGERPRFTEFSPDGRVVLDATFTRGASQQAWKEEWVGHPYTAPKVVAYAQHCNGEPLFVYASWNGATEVTSWRFWTSRTAKDGSWQSKKNVTKNGFETQALLAHNFSPYVFAEALDSSGAVLGTSPTTKTYIPTPDLRSECTKSGCHKRKQFAYLEKDSYWDHCRRRVGPHYSTLDVILYAVEVLAVLITFVEASAWLAGHLIWFLIGFSDKSSPVMGSPVAVPLRT